MTAHQQHHHHQHHLSYPLTRSTPKFRLMISPTCPRISGRGVILPLKNNPDSHNAITAPVKLEGNKFIARVDSGHETATSEEEEDSSTPHHSPLPPQSASSTPVVSTSSVESTAPQLPLKFDDTTTCSQCKLTSRRFPITSEKDLYRLSTACTHTPRRTPLFTPLEAMNRSSSAVIYSERHRHYQLDPDHTSDLARRPPPKLTGTLNSSTKAIIRPIAFKPTEMGNRLHPNYSSMKQQSLERRNSENNFLRQHPPDSTTATPTTRKLMAPELSSLVSHNNQLNTQRFGGSLCNVLPSKEFYNKNDSTLHIDDVGITPLGKTCDSTPAGSTPVMSSNPFEPSQKVELLDKGSSWESEMKHLQGMYSAHLRAAHQRAIKLEQALAAHSCQLQQERRKIRTELDESLKVNAVLRQELESRNSQLEEAEWAVCLLKAQLKDYQGDQVSKSHEVTQLRSHVNSLTSEVVALRGSLSQVSLNSKSLERENAGLKQRLQSSDKTQRDIQDENEILRKKLKDMELKYSVDSSMWEAERAKWSEEQKRVLRYQKALQHNYIMTCQKAQDLSIQVEYLSYDRQLTGTKRNPADDPRHGDV